MSLPLVVPVTCQSEPRLSKLTAVCSGRKRIPGLSSSDFTSVVMPPLNENASRGVAVRLPRNLCMKIPRVRLPKRFSSPVMRGNTEYAFAKSGSDASTPLTKGSMAFSSTSRPTRLVMNSLTVSSSCPPLRTSGSARRRSLPDKVHTGELIIAANFVGTATSLSSCIM